MVVCAWNGSSSLVSAPHNSFGEVQLFQIKSLKVWRCWAEVFWSMTVTGKKSTEAQNPFWSLAVNYNIPFKKSHAWQRMPGFFFFFKFTLQLPFLDFRLSVILLITFLCHFASPCWSRAHWHNKTRLMCCVSRHQHAEWQHIHLLEASGWWYTVSFTANTDNHLQLGYDDCAQYFFCSNMLKGNASTLG